MSTTSALNAVVWVFAGMTVVIIVMFAITVWLAIRHRGQRRNAIAHLDSEERWVADPAGRLDNLTVGDLVADPDLRRAVLKKRSQLADFVSAKDVKDAEAE